MVCLFSLQTVFFCAYESIPTLMLNVNTSTTYLVNRHRLQPGIRTVFFDIDLSVFGGGYWEGSGAPMLGDTPIKEKSVFTYTKEGPSTALEVAKPKTIQGSNFPVVLLESQQLSNFKMVQFCAGCEGPITDRFLLNVLDRPWHIKCVQCCECKAKLTEKCFSREGKLFCKSDFFRWVHLF